LIHGQVTRLWPAGLGDEIMSNKIIAVGSVDGVLTSAALIRFLANRDAESQVMFTQAFTCHETLDFIEPGDSVYLVDLAVNNRDIECTRSFIEAIFDKKAYLVAIADEHGSDAWYKIIPTDLEGLIIHPQNRSPKYPSSGAVLREVLRQSDGWDEYCTDLTELADLADKAEFVGLGSLLNKAIKADIKDQQRRVYLAEHFAQTSEPDDQIKQWLIEYEALEANTKAVVESAYQEGDLYFFDSREYKVDRTSMVVELDRKFPTAKVAVCRGFAYDRDRGGSFPCYTFMLRNKFNGINLGEILPSGWGMAAVMNVEDADYPEALEIVKASL
jgi:hypothetical protein